MSHLTGCNALSQGSNDSSVPIELSIKTNPGDLFMEAAVEAALPTMPLKLDLVVLPSAAPAALVLLLHENRLPLQAQSPSHHHWPHEPYCQQSYVHVHAIMRQTLIEGVPR